MHPVPAWFPWIWSLVSVRSNSLSHDLPLSSYHLLSESFTLVSTDCCSFHRLLRVHANTAMLSCHASTVYWSSALSLILRLQKAGHDHEAMNRGCTNQPTNRRKIAKTRGRYVPTGKKTTTKEKGRERPETGALCEGKRSVHCTCTWRRIRSLYEHDMAMIHMIPYRA